jgi:hypothetical protein
VELAKHCLRRALFIFGFRRQIASVDLSSSPPNWSYGLSGPCLDAHARGEVRRQDWSKDRRGEDQYENNIEQLGIDQPLPRRVERSEAYERCCEGRGHL